MGTQSLLDWTVATLLCAAMSQLIAYVPWHTVAALCVWILSLIPALCSWVLSLVASVVMVVMPFLLDIVKILAVHVGRCCTCLCVHAVWGLLYACIAASKLAWSIVLAF